MGYFVYFWSYIRNIDIFGCYFDVFLSKLRAFCLKFKKRNFVFLIAEN